MFYLFVGLTTGKELGYKHRIFFGPEASFFLVQEDWGSTAASSERTDRVILRS